MPGIRDAGLDALVRCVGFDRAEFVRAEDDAVDDGYEVFLAGREEPVCGVQVLRCETYGGRTTYMPYCVVRGEAELAHRYLGECGTRAEAMGACLAMATIEGWVP